jgi:hypothetical protein
VLRERSETYSSPPERNIAVIIVDEVVASWSGSLSSYYADEMVYSRADAQGRQLHLVVGELMYD